MHQFQNNKKYIKLIALNFITLILLIFFVGTYAPLTCDQRGELTGASLYHFAVKTFIEIFTSISLLECGVSQKTKLWSVFRTDIWNFITFRVGSGCYAQRFLPGLTTKWRFLANYSLFTTFHKKQCIECHILNSNYVPLNWKSFSWVFKEDVNYLFQNKFFV